MHAMERRTDSVSTAYGSAFTPHDETASRQTHSFIAATKTVVEDEIWKEHPSSRLEASLTILGGKQIQYMTYGVRLRRMDSKEAQIERPPRHTNS